MAQIIRISSVGDIINTIVNHFDNNNIEEICMAFKGKDGQTYATWTKNASFFERVGMVETLKHDIFKDIE